MATAKVFWSGRSQAVRLPKDFRFDSKEVLIRREGDSVILTPLASGWEWLKKMPGYVDPDFEAAVNEELPQQERPELDEFFK